MSSQSINHGDSNAAGSNTASGVFSPTTAAVGASGAPPTTTKGTTTNTNPAPAASTAMATSSSASPVQNLNQIVTDYLLKRGFTKTEAIFRQESSRVGTDGRPIHESIEDLGPKKYLRAFKLLQEWIENNLDQYKPELRKLLWPIFVYSYLALVEEHQGDEAYRLLTELRPIFEEEHGDDLKTFATITLSSHVRENEVACLYRENRYRISLSQHVFASVLNFIHREADKGGSVIVTLLQSHCQVLESAGGPLDPFSFEAIVRRGQASRLHAEGKVEAEVPDGIPGVVSGVTNKDIVDVCAPLCLGPLPMEADLRDDVRAELDEVDQLHPPAVGVPSLADEFERKIKREESGDGPSRVDLPLPPSRARDVVMEMQKIREHRDRFKVQPHAGPTPLPVSICMFTFHNTLGSVTCMEFSSDQKLVAVGTMDSYIRVWTLDGKPLKSRLPNEKDLKINNRKLIGHSAPVYGLAFSDAAANSFTHLIFSNVEGSKMSEPMELNAKILLSCAADGQIRLWALDVWTCLCIYKSHDGPVFRLAWGPHGHYFASAGWDKTVRVFAQDHASAVRILVGHDSSISAITWHPNGTYVFSASDDTDKSIRMWSITTGNCVRLYAGHLDHISSLVVSSDGRTLASGDWGGNIMIWDIDKGVRTKFLRGHGRGSIPSMSFSVEGNVLISGSLDGSLRLWDINFSHTANPSKTANPQDTGTGASGVAEPGGGSTGIGSSSGQTLFTSGSVVGPSSSGSGSGSSKKKSKDKEVQVSPEQISVFFTKRTPVLKAQFTRMNLVVAGGCFDPER